MAAETKTIYEHTEPMLTDGPIVEKYRIAAKHYNAMALAIGVVGVPETLHAALYATRHGEADIRQAVQNANDIARELADGLISLMLVCRMRQEFGWTPGCMPDEVSDPLPRAGLPSRELAERQGFTGPLSQTTLDRTGEQVKKK